MSTLKTLMIASVLTVAVPSLTQAATLGVLTNDYGTGPGQVDPGGSDVLNADSVEVSDNSAGRFFDSFDLTPFAGDTITSFALTLDFENAGPRGLFNLLEEWEVRIQGDDGAAQADDIFALLNSEASPQTFIIDATSDTGGTNVFAHSVATGSFEFWFAENTFGGLFGTPDAFDLNSASLEVFGEPAVVPVPASAALLLLGLGGLAAARRRS